MSRFPGNIAPPIARSARREAGNGPPKAQTPGNAQANVRRRLMGSGERPRRGPTEGVRCRPAAPDLSGHWTEGRWVARPAASFFWFLWGRLMPLRTPLYETHLAA